MGLGAVSPYCEETLIGFDMIVTCEDDIHVVVLGGHMDGVGVIVTDWEALGIGLEAIATCWNGTGSLDAVYSLDDHAVSVCCESLLMCCIIMKVTCWDCVGGHTNMLGGHIYEVECHITCLEGVRDRQRKQH